MAENSTDRYSLPIGWSGEFSLVEQEACYLQYHWPERYKQLRASMGIGGFIFLLFAITDLVMIQPVEFGWLFAALRVLIFVLIVMLVLPEREEGYSPQVDLMLLFLLLGTSTVVLASFPFYGEGILFHVASIFLLVIGFYLFVPTQFRFSVIASIYISLGFLLVVVTTMNPGLHNEVNETYQMSIDSFVSIERYHASAEGHQLYWVELLIACLLLATGNILGPVTARRLNRLQRKDFARQQTLETEMAVRREAEFELAAARDNLEEEVKTRTVDLLDAQKALEWQANYDPLTGLPNRWLVQDRLERAISRHKRTHSGGALMFIDLDRFKQVNDSMGHRAGDQVLVEAAKRIAGLLRSNDTVARFGGDEFVIILEEVLQPSDVEPVIRKITEDCSRPFVVEGAEIFLSASIGVTLFPGDGDDVNILLSHADTAMYQAKGAGGGTYRFFSAQMNEATTGRMRMETELRRALARNELSLNYQPLVDSRNGRIVGAEALLRWNSSNLGFVSPVDFIPLAEQCGLIDSIGEWVLYTACRDASEWPAQKGGEVPFVAVNVSARQLQTGDFPTTLESVLETTGFDPQRLELELTESFLANDPAFAKKQLEQIKQLGIRLSIDDFGTGYSALSSLRQFPFSTLKIDRSFMPQDGVNSEEARLVSAIIAMAENFGLQTIAEGVETAAQWAFLRQRGCELLQGFHMSRPVPLPEFLELLIGDPFPLPAEALIVSAMPESSGDASQLM